MRCFRKRSASSPLKERSCSIMKSLPSRVMALIAKHGEERALRDFLMEELYSCVGEGWEQEDDITLLTLKRSASLS
jgi:hypothetical protein